MLNASLHLGWGQESHVFNRMLKTHCNSVCEDVTICCNELMKLCYSPTEREGVSFTSQLIVFDCDSIMTWEAGLHISDQSRYVCLLPLSSIP